MYFKIDGNDILHLIEENGIQWSRNDVDSDEAGRALNAYMFRGRLDIKERIDLRIRPLTQEESMWLLNIIMPEFVILEWDFDPMFGTISKQMYSNNVPATCADIDPETGIALWTGISFPLVER